MLELLRNRGNPVPAGTPVFLSTTIGAIEAIEQEFSGEGCRCQTPHLQELIALITRLFAASRVILLSGACAGSGCAVAYAAMLISQGKIESAAVIGVDAISEFVASGFSSLNALSPEICRPFDVCGRGLNLGEAAAITVLSGRPQTGTLGKVLGWAGNADAWHATAPSPDGKPLSEAIRAALGKAALEPEDIACIAAHGTGTAYNDSMESAAFRQTFHSPPPAFSIKGGCGHTLAAAGLLQLGVALEAFRLKRTPPNLNLLEALAGASGFVNAGAMACRPGKAVLSVNSGFSGMNVALLLGQS